MLKSFTLRRLCVALQERQRYNFHTLHDVDKLPTSKWNGEREGWSRRRMWGGTIGKEKSEKRLFVLRNLLRFALFSLLLLYLSPFLSSLRFYASISSRNCFPLIEVFLCRTFSLLGLGHCASIQALWVPFYSTLFVSRSPSLDPILALSIRF